MKFLVDSENVIDFFKGKTELFHLFDDTENVFISAMSVGILYEKVLKADNPDEKLEISKDFCQLLNILPVNEAIAEKYAELITKYNELNSTFIWLCATAIVNDLVLVSSHPEIIKIKEVVAKQF